MINLITGLPGASKTLYTISFVKKWAEKDNRPVFYSGITDLNKDKLPWTEINAEEWFKCPTGAIVIIDECQRIFRPRTISKDVPEFVSKLETHRHLGIDLVLITQHPLLADSAIRRLSGNHRHIVRRFGMQSSTIHQWDSVRDNCDKSNARIDSNKTVWGFDKSAFDLYKSAELHTVKRSIPKRVFFLLSLPILLFAAGWVVYSYMHKTPLEKFNDNQRSQIGAVPSSPQQNSFTYKTALDDAKQYVFENTPRIAGVEHSAPKYDKLTEPTVAPFPVGCIKSKDKCTCYSQQATPVNASPEMCENIVQHGIFEDFDVNGTQARDELRKDDSGASGKSKQVSSIDITTESPLLIAPAQSDHNSMFVPHKKTSL